MKLKNRQNEVVEYSTDYNFFLSHQIAVWKSGSTIEFNSRLESKCFKKIFYIQSNELDIPSITKTIHEEILKGMHGSGELVN